MKKAFLILLVIAIAAGGFMITEYIDGGRAYADTSSEEVYILAGPADNGLKTLPASMFIFTDVEMNKKIEWFFTPLEEKVLSVMSLEQKIGQMFIVRPESLHGSTYVTDAMRDALIQRMPCGIIMFDDNIIDPGQIRAFNRELHDIASAYSPVQMLISVDEEGGMVARIANNWNFDVTGYESMLAIGSTGDVSQAESVGETIGAYLSEYGFDLDFAPVADCFTNLNNTVIGDRAFGSDPELVSDMVGACIDGFHSQGIMTSIKHYPGHGDTDSDTHTGAAVTSYSWDELLGRELRPFMDNMDVADMIMASHIISNGVEGDELPATISKTMIEDKLRGELGYEGVVITDSFEMGAISYFYAPDEAAVRAVEAGCDIILCPDDYETAYDALLEAVKSERISEERIDESILRILRMKLKYGYEYEYEYE